MSGDHLLVLDEGTTSTRATSMKLVLTMPERAT